MAILFSLCQFCFDWNWHNGCCQSVKMELISLQFCRHKLLVPEVWNPCSQREWGRNWFATLAKMVTLVADQLCCCRIHCDWTWVTDFARWYWYQWPRMWWLCTLGSTWENSVCSNSELPLEKNCPRDLEALKRCAIISQIGDNSRPLSSSEASIWVHPSDL